MENHDETQVDYGTGQKKLGIYSFGMLCCTILTLISFWTVMSGKFSKMEMFVSIYVLACIQFLVQLICFLRLNTNTEQGRMNVMSLIFTGVILITIISGSLWIMWNLQYYMAN